MRREALKGYLPRCALRDQRFGRPGGAHGGSEALPRSSAQARSMYDPSSVLTRNLLARVHGGGTCTVRPVSGAPALNEVVAVAFLMPGSVLETSRTTLVRQLDAGSDARCGN